MYRRKTPYLLYKKLFNRPGSQETLRKSGKEKHLIIFIEIHQMNIIITHVNGWGGGHLFLSGFWSGSLWNRSIVVIPWRRHFFFLSEIFYAWVHQFKEVMSLMSGFPGSGRFISCKYTLLAFQLCKLQDGALFSGIQLKWHRRRRLTSKCLNNVASFPVSYRNTQ